MRIRKAEKLLGFTSENPAARSPPTPWDSAAAIVAAAGLLCEINRSRCVDDSTSLHSSNHQKEEVEIANDDEEELGIVGKGSDDNGEKEKQEEKVKDKEEIKYEKEPARKRREKEAEATGMIKRKKMNAEGWHCKRKQPNSYRTHMEVKISGDDGCRGRKRTNHRKKSAAAVEACTGTASNYYDKYYVLGIDSSEGVGGGNESAELDDVSDREAVVDGLNGVDDEEVEGGNLCNFNYKKKTWPLNKSRKYYKRGRKPVKARSLKSLLSFKVC